MFKLIESMYQDPIRLPLKPGLKLTAGHVVKFAEYNGDVVIDLCDGYSPIGLLGNRCCGGNVVDFTKRSRALVYPQRMIADIGKFDRRNEVKVGDSLYCNARGVLSSKRPFENAYVLAKVISIPSTEKKYMQILWL